MIAMSSYIQTAESIQPTNKKTSSSTLKKKDFLSKSLLIDIVLLIVAVGVMTTKLSTISNFAKTSKDVLISKLLKLALYRMNSQVLPNQPVEWSFPIKKTTTSVGTESDKRPNIIFIVADDLGYNDLHGSRLPVTKNIRKIGEDGVFFSKAYAGHATCSPSRASMVTGRFPTRFGFEFTPVHYVMSKQLGQSKMFNFEEASNFNTSTHSSDLSDSRFIKPPGKITNLEEMAVPTDVPMVSEILRDAGYDTMFLGKWHMGASTGTRPWERGYEQTLSFLHGASQFFSSGNKSGIEAHVNDFMDDMIWDYVPFMIAKEDGPNFRPDEYITDYLSKQAVEAIKATRRPRRGVAEETYTRNPFFLHLCYNAPHTPLHALDSDYFDPSLDHITNHRERVYVAMIKAVDRGVEQIMSTVRELGEEDNTLVIFTSDNGGASYIGLPDLNLPFRGGKASFFEGGLRVPLLMKWPNQIAANTVHEKTVGHVDIFSTLVNAAGVSEERVSQLPVDGVNLLKSLPHPDAATSRVDQEPVLLDLTARPPIFWRSGHYRCLIYGDWKLSVAARPHKAWLYNLARDPTEVHNLAPAYVEPEIQYFSESGNWSLGTAHSWTDASNQSLQVYPEVLLTRHDLPLSEVYDIMYAYMTHLNTHQVEPLWPSLSETPVLIDKNIQASYVSEAALTRGDFAKVSPNVFSYDTLWEVFFRPERPAYELKTVSPDEEVVLWPN